MKCRQMDIIYNMFSEISPRQAVIAVDILRILFNQRKRGMSIVEINYYFKNRYIHSVGSAIRWLRDRGYVSQLNSGFEARYTITLSGVKKHWEIWDKIRRRLYSYDSSPCSYRAIY